MVVGSFKELLNLIILYQMMYITDWSKYSLGCMNNYYFIQNIKITTLFRVKIAYARFELTNKVKICTCSEHVTFDITISLRSMELSNWNS